MKLHRFAGEFDLSRDNIKIFDKHFLHQVKNVLRLGQGDKVVLIDTKLHEALSQITALTKDFAEVKVLEVKENENEPERHVVLYSSILTRGNFELVAQKATEVGVKEIVPLLARRTVKRVVRRDRLEKIIKEAAEQSGRGIIPILQDPREFREAIVHAGGNKINLFFDSSGFPIENWKLKIENSSPIGVWIGPEGGWAEDEIQRARESGLEIASLGKLTLRAETAAIIASYLAVHH